MPLRWQEHYQEEISETASVETDDNMGPHPEQVILILWRCETSSNISGGFAPCSICPYTRSVAAARSEEFVICVLLGWRGAGDGGGCGRCVAYFMRRCSELTEWWYEVIEISQEDAVVSAVGVNIWYPRLVSLGCCSGLVLGTRA